MWVLPRYSIEVVGLCSISCQNINMLFKMIQNYQKNKGQFQNFWTFISPSEMKLDYLSLDIHCYSTLYQPSLTNLSKSTEEKQMFIFCTTMPAVKHLPGFSYAMQALTWPNRILSHCSNKCHFNTTKNCWTELNPLLSLNGL